MAISTDNSFLEKMKVRFAEKFGGSSRVFRAPGRVNLIGEHTDYNDGFALPAAIDRYTCVAIGPRDDETLNVFSENLNESAQIDLREKTPHARNHWSDYVQGVAIQLRNSGVKLRGANLLIHSDVPSGSGLSSSAALEVSVGKALLANSNHSVGQLELAKLCQRAENEFVGARCGIMDQFAACFGRSGHAILLDCRSLEGTALPLPADISMVICNTMVKHVHSGGEYNARRAQCEEGVQLLKKWNPKVIALRDVSLADLESHRADLPPLIFRRCRHVISENARVLDTVSALRTENLAAIGKLMAESHRSLRDDFEVSCRELDVMVALAERSEGVIGARMTGGGFGGCTINLVKNAHVETFCESIRTRYKQAANKTPEIYVSTAGEGASEIS
ncbi:MAG TPA: galactokinase [Candidatus Dormibacteraeota bacterium]|jgi:galactokinase|nr:galactokinase [Candidatus Dormibacteraeota bacterium]